MKVAICDDIREYRLSLRAYVEAYFAKNHLALSVFEYSSGNEILDSGEIFDIVLLDIELGDLNGIDVAKELQKRNKKIVVLIVTSHSNYLDDAMDIHAIRFINKPISQSRILSALEKAIQEIDANLITVHLRNNQLLRTYASDVVYIEAKFKKVIIYTIDNSYESKESLKSLSELFNASFFASPHNSYIVNLNYVRSFKRDEIFLLKPYEYVRISVASRKQSDFRKKMFDFVGEGYNAKNSN